ncbi:2-oxoisovalerate dehydrogenase subunit beta mitochondrial precursor [Sphaerulina musiva SO2202]|uniref:3-methyl-2-oxobutanoate dehydrogenase (2-methylpropanoyl-transferring) n=1 Tax=Sphaerulina musiva (strain SO2202) TaxID=692275 RepID=N1QJT8_SPHMS|nr:2-oxoisovalerate dehydrogenase subunit beta mitochondrial precursor [Sphaerulina musiva SO2202]EMF16547.1 2-oxoisovalerate dehydrogenase subunit beta mitochondrial precursor [Sphaerulina musiva SO2202]
MARPSPKLKSVTQLLFARPASRGYASHPPNARLNTPTDYGTTPLLHHSSKSALSNVELPAEARNGTTSRINLFQAINSALAHALRSDPRVLLFGEDVAFGGVFRCSMNLASEFGDDRVFNTPLSEQGIVGFAVGAAVEGMKPIAEIQFADYVYPAFDQIVNEAAKIRYRAGTNADAQSCGGLVIRMPAGGVGHGALYHSQSPESLFTHVPGVRVVIPRSPSQAKGLLLAAIASPDPVVFLEPKILYRAAVEHVPAEPYMLPLSKAEVLKEGKDVTIISYGTPLYTCQTAITAAEKDFNCSVELIDLRTIYPWDRQGVVTSVNKTGRCIVVHESMVNAGVGAEVAATVQEKCFLRLEAPVQRVAGWSTHAGLAYERFNIPDVTRVYDAIRKALEW